MLFSERELLPIIALAGTSCTKTTKYLRSWSKAAIQEKEALKRVVRERLLPPYVRSTTRALRPEARDLAQFLRTDPSQYGLGSR